MHFPESVPSRCYSVSRGPSLSGFSRLPLCGLVFFLDFQQDQLSGHPRQLNQPLMLVVRERAA